MKEISRRDFLKTSGVAAAGIALAPTSALGKTAKKKTVAPSDKLNIAGIGVGGMGNANLKELEAVEGVNIVALCDVDWKYAKDPFERNPQAKRYKDFRVMYDEMGRISTQCSSPPLTTPTPSWPPTPSRWASTPMSRNL